MKQYFKMNTKTIVATALGAALFTVLHMYVKIPSPIPDTSLHTAYGLAASFGALFGPITGGLMAFIGHALSDGINFGSPWWSWVIASGVCGFICGFAYKKVNVEGGKLSKKDIVTFNIIQALANIISFIAVAPVLDILVYKEPVNYVFTQGTYACIMNIIATGVIGTMILALYVAAKPKKGSLSKES